MNSLNAHPLTAHPATTVGAPANNQQRPLDRLDAIIARLNTIEHNMDTIIRTLEERSRPADY